MEGPRGAPKDGPGPLFWHMHHKNWYKWISWEVVFALMIDLHTNVSATEKWHIVEFSVQPCWRMSKFHKVTIAAFVTLCCTGETFPKWINWMWWSHPSWAKKMILKKTKNICDSFQFLLGGHQRDGAFFNCVCVPALFECAVVFQFCSGQCMILHLL